MRWPNGVANGVISRGSQTGDLRRDDPDVGGDLNMYVVRGSGLHVDSRLGSSFKLGVQWARRTGDGSFLTEYRGPPRNSGTVHFTSFSCTRESVCMSYLVCSQWTTASPHSGTYSVISVISRHTTTLIILAQLERIVPSTEYNVHKCNASCNAMRSHAINQVTPR